MYSAIACYTVLRFQFVARQKADSLIFLRAFFFNTDLFQTKSRNSKRFVFSQAMFCLKLKKKTNKTKRQIPFISVWRNIDERQPASSLPCVFVLFVAFVMDAEWSPFTKRKQASNRLRNGEWKLGIIVENIVFHTTRKATTTKISWMIAKFQAKNKPSGGF